MERSRKRRNIHTSLKFVRISSKNTKLFRHNFLKYFGNFGEVENVRLHGSVGIVRFNEAESVDKAVKQEMHTLCGVNILVEPFKYFQVSLTGKSKQQPARVTFEEALTNLDDLGHSIKELIIDIYQPSHYSIIYITFDNTTLTLRIDKNVTNEDAELMFKTNFQNLESLVITNLKGSLQLLKTISELQNLRVLKLKDCYNFENLNCLAKASAIREIVVKYVEIRDAPKLNLIDLVSSLPHLNKLKIDQVFDNETYEYLREFYRSRPKPILSFYIDKC